MKFNKIKPNSQIFKENVQKHDIFFELLTHAWIIWKIHSNIYKIDNIF